MHCKLIAFNCRFIHSCLALFYVRTALTENLPGCRPTIMQNTINDPYYPTLRRIGSGKPTVLFFSVYIWNSIYVGRLLKDLVKLLPGTPLILGGPQAPTLARSLKPEVAEQCTVVHGEIEGIDPSFYLDLAVEKLKKYYSCAKAVAFRSPYRPDDFAGPLKNKHVYYESSRGCPFNCTYCLSAAEKGVRHLPLSQLFEEIKAILRFGPKIIRFVDRTFNDQVQRALDIWRFLAEQPGETLFHFEMAPDRFNEEMLQFLAQVGPGRFQFELGIQSTNPPTLAAINRKCDRARLGPAIRRLVALDTIHMHLDLILGLPHETRESFGRSFAEVFELGPHYIQMGLLKVLPDTPISRSLAEFGMIVCENPPYELLANRWLAISEMEDLFWFGECVEAFYNNRFFRSFWAYLRRSSEDISPFFQGLLNLCRQRGFFGLAATQELMSSLLLEMTRSRSDRELLRELLVFDWLRCGHRFLPDHLGQAPLSLLKKKLRRQMGQNWEGVFNYRNRDEFFRQGVFVRFSGELLQEVGVSNDGRPGYVCFQAEREKRVFGLQKCLLIPQEISGA